MLTYQQNIQAPRGSNVPTQHHIPQSRTRPHRSCICFANGNVPVVQHRPRHREQYSSTLREQPSPSHPHRPSRRSLLQQAAVTCLPALLGPQIAECVVPSPAQAYIVDEVVAQSVFAIASRSVVSVNDYKLQGGAEIFEGVGTGIVWDKYGHIVTNYHCVGKYVLDKSGKQLVKVMLDDGGGSSTPYTAAVIGTDAMHDLAVLQVSYGLQCLHASLGTCGSR
eukprot:GHUV01013348.1.p1 GENE.GHUV01013348.1~~GHUV01013348.1.p1  ORF type:complete len:222 (+),score=21.37 GHUV01013348.1:78-743(+)